MKSCRKSFLIILFVAFFLSLGLSSLTEKNVYAEEDYGIIVGNTSVTSANKDNVLAGDPVNDGKVSYDPNTHILTFDKAVISESHTNDHRIVANVTTATDITVEGTASFSNADVGFFSGFGVEVDFVGEKTDLDIESNRICIQVSNCRIYDAQIDAVVINNSSYGVLDCSLVELYDATLNVEGLANAGIKSSALKFCGDNSSLKVKNCQIGIDSESVSVDGQNTHIELTPKNLQGVKCDSMTVTGGEIIINDGFYIGIECESFSMFGGYIEISQSTTAIVADSIQFVGDGVNAVLYGCDGIKGKDVLIQDSTLDVWSYGNKGYAIFAENAISISGKPYIDAQNSKSGYAVCANKAINLDSDSGVHIAMPEEAYPIITMGDDYVKRVYIADENGIADNVLIHAHQIEFFAEKEPTLDAEGWWNHYECVDCGKWFDDSHGSREIEDIYLHYYVRTKKIPMPDVNGMTYEEAEKYLTDYFSEFGLNTSITIEHDYNEKSTNNVIRQDPKAGEGISTDSENGYAFINLTFGVGSNSSLYWPTPAPTSSVKATATPIPTVTPTVTAAPTATVKPTTTVKPTVTTKPTVTPNSKPTVTPKPTVTVKSDPMNTVTPTSAVEGGSNDDPKKDIRAFVDRIYNYVLGRESEEDGAQYWTDELYKFSRSGAEVAQGFIFSEEFYNRKTSNVTFVTILYKTFFDRDPDDAGMEYWLSQLINGSMDRVAVANGFIYSQEWANTCAAYGIRSGGEIKPTVSITPSDLTYSFVERMYTTAMKRECDQEGRNYWANELANFNISGEQIGAAFFLSEEMVNYKLSDKEFIDRLYATFMNREADAEGSAFWQGILKGGADRSEAVYGFTRSPEFTEKCIEARILPYV